MGTLVWVSIYLVRTQNYPQTNISPPDSHTGVLNRIPLTCYPVTLTNLYEIILSLGIVETKNTEL